MAKPQIILVSNRLPITVVKQPDGQLVYDVSNGGLAYLCLRSRAIPTPYG
jgi:hypothetical protein